MEEKIILHDREGRKEKRILNAMDCPNCALSQSTNG
jgi:hypothetical protein